MSSLSFFSLAAVGCFFCFGHLLFGHLNLFRISNFVLRIYFTNPSSLPCFCSSLSSPSYPLNFSPSIFSSSLLLFSSLPLCRASALPLLTFSPSHPLTLSTSFFTALPLFPASALPFPHLLTFLPSYLLNFFLHLSSIPRGSMFACCKIFFSLAFLISIWYTLFLKCGTR